MLPGRWVPSELRRCDAISTGRGRPSQVAAGRPRKGNSARGSGSSSTSTSTFGRYELYPGVETPIKGKGPDDIDMVVVRENNEDLYVGAGGFTRKGTPEEVAIQTSINTRAGVERCLRFAFELARRTRPASGRFAAYGRAERHAGWSGRSHWWPRPTS